MKNLKLKIFVLVLLMFCVSNVSALTIDKDTKLTEDINEQVIIDGKKVVIDLNGHKITNNEDALIVQNGADVTVKGNGTIQSTGDTGVVVINAKFTLESGDIKSQEFGVFTSGKGTFNMNGGTITTVDNCGAGGNGRAGYEDYTININGGVINANITSAGYSSCGIYHPNRGTVNMTGGTINSSNGAGIVQRAGTLNVTGGTINTQEATKDFVGKVGDSRVVVPASAIVVDKKANYPQVSTLSPKISDSVVINSVAKNIAVVKDDSDPFTVKAEGGIYTDEPAADEIAEGYVAKKIIAGANENKYTIVKESELKLKVISGMISKADVDQKEVEAINKEIKDKYTLIGYFDVLLTKTNNNGDIVEYVSEAESKVKVTLGLPDGLPKVKDGYIRKYYVVKMHNGKATLIDDVTDNGDGTVSFMSDEFSTYAVAYTDVVNSSNPATSDTIVIYLAILGICIVGLGAVILSRREKVFE
ncbi:MAG: hypothetical protein ILA19_04840 [Bacilli bacterium]|nr:hypothetical protein [Bacilli bacterium]